MPGLIGRAREYTFALPFFDARTDEPLHIVSEPEHPTFQQSAFFAFRNMYGVRNALRITSEQLHDTLITLFYFNQRRQTLLSVAIFF